MADYQDPTFGTRTAREGAGPEAHARREDGGARLRQHGEEIRRDGEALAQHVGAMIGDLEEEWGERAVERPYAVIGGCFALGYVLGGGLPAGFVRFAAGMASRMVFASLARGALTAAAQRD